MLANKMIANVLQIIRFKEDPLIRLGGLYNMLIYVLISNKFHWCSSFFYAEHNGVQNSVSINVILKNFYIFFKLQAYENCLNLSGTMKCNKKYIKVLYKKNMFC